MRRETRDRILMGVLGVAFFLNIAFISLIPSTSKESVVVGYVLLGLGFLLFALSVITLRGKGTSSLIEEGIYAVVRHPMYLGGMLMFLSHIFFSQYWVVVAGTVAAVVCCILSMYTADQRNIEKFGLSYERYMGEVPGMNILRGILQKIRHRKT